VPVCNELVPTRSLNNLNNLFWCNFTCFQQVLFFNVNPCCMKVTSVFQAIYDFCFFGFESHRAPFSFWSLYYRLRTLTRILTHNHQCHDRTFRPLCSKWANPTPTYSPFTPTDYPIPSPVTLAHCLAISSPFFLFLLARVTHM